jgi:hypothetical protein
MNSPARHRTARESPQAAQTTNFSKNTNPPTPERSLGHQAAASNRLIGQLDRVHLDKGQATQSEEN